MVTDAYGDNKWVRTAEWAKKNRVDLANCTFYTDSVSDRKCAFGYRSRAADASCARAIACAQAHA